MKNYKFKCMFSFAFGDKYHSKLKHKVKNLGLEDNIIWLGHVKYEEMCHYYNASDVVISVPSSDSSPKSVYEAMFCGRPVIITDLEWSHEILQESECVCRVKVNDANGLSDSIINIISNKKYSKFLGRNAVKVAIENFDYNDNMKKMEKIMFDMIKIL